MDARLARLSIVIPALNEAQGICGCLDALAPVRARGHEIIVVDGGSGDQTLERARPLADKVMTSERGRARQMNAGARAAKGDALLFLHADTRLPADADSMILESLKDHLWGRFDVRIDGRHALLPLVAFAMNVRSRHTGIATGDQAIFVRREAFAGFPEVQLMEDVAFSKAMKRRGAPACLRSRAVTSGRRWEQGGVLRTVALMWRLRLLYALGASPERLAREYAERR